MDSSCFELRLSTLFTAINQSWTCVPEHAGTEDACLFNYVQQFQRPKSCGYFEATLIFLASLCVFPCNMIALVNFKKRQVTREFMFLVSCLAFFNCLHALTGFIRGLERISNNLGMFGCIASCTGGSVIMTSSFYIFALISIERNLSVRNFSGNINSTKPRFFVWLVSVVAVGLLCTAVYTYQLHGNGAVQIVKDPFSNLDVCVVFSSRLFFRGDALSAFFGLFSMGAPLMLIAANYAHLFYFVKKAAANTRRVNMGYSFRSAYNEHREVRLALLMSLSIVQFAVCIAPMVVAISFVNLDAANQQYRIQSSALFYSVLLGIIDAALNPFWSSFVVIGANNVDRKRQARSQSNFALTCFSTASEPKQSNSDIASEPNASSLLKSRGFN